ncbi:hypothetical protein O6H91_02G007900 [Diphasiastrum complanatum]|uniref:Uncharacterized protein n=1 Tax=Diphasiastrum complanatum TaxID=34168 RepID=A0ACC2ECN7_DIPCM|nr:hypothetical protein O6H91_02G007900 [Diphasiastrum complanatum]
MHDGFLLIQCYRYTMRQANLTARSSPCSTSQQYYKVELPELSNPHTHLLAYLRMMLVNMRMIMLELTNVHIPSNLCCWPPCPLALDIGVRLLKGKRDLKVLSS